MKAAIILCGSGCLDGSEVHEATLLFLMLKQKEIDVDFFSLDEEISESIAHHTKQPIPHARNMMEMSSRISRGEIKDLKTLNVEEYEILAIPGGFGVAQNLSDWSEKQENCSVNKYLSFVIRKFFEAKKTIIAMCIAPMIIGRVLQGSGIKMTVGTDKKQLAKLASMGIEAVDCTSDQACLDKVNKVYSVPAYMEPPDIVKIYQSLLQVLEEL